jgi:hypothetical protein
MQGEKTMTKQQSESMDNRREKKERVQLDFTPEALAKLDELKDFIGANTRAETIRQALRLFDWFVNETEPDHLIIIQNTSGEIVAKFKASLLHNETKSTTRGRSGKAPATNRGADNINSGR